MKSYTVEEVQKHNTAQDCWVIIDGKVFDVTKFLTEHPGGKKVLLKKGGKDASKEFKTFHNASIMQKLGLPMQVGVIGTTEPVKEVKKEEPKATPVNKHQQVTSQDEFITGTQALFGEQYPYGDPSWYQNFNR
jgi:cytochrome b involved in lipid metabolism